MQDSTPKIAYNEIMNPNDQVKRIRDLLRVAETKRGEGDEETACNLVAQSMELEDTLIRALTRRIEVESTRAFSGLKKSEMAKDAFCQIIHELLVSIRNLSESQDYLETHFNNAFKKKSLDAVRKVLSENGIERGQTKEGHGHVLVRIEDGAHANQDGESETRANVIIDPRSTAAFDDCIMGITLEKALARVDEKHRNVFMLRYQGGYGWSEIAKRCGLSDKTAMTYYKDTRFVLLRELAPEMAGEIANEK